MVLQRSMLNWGGQSAIGICIVLYIYRSTMRCVKFGIAVCKASMLNYIDRLLPWDVPILEIYVV